VISDFRPMLDYTATQSRPILENRTYYPDITLTIGHHRPKRQIITGKGKDINEVAIQIKRSLEVEMDQAAERQALKWLLH